MGNIECAALVQLWLSLRTRATLVPHWAGSCTGGLSRLSQGGVDVISLDTFLSERATLETFKRASQLKTHVPIIFLSGCNLEQLARQLMRIVCPGIRRLQGRLARAKAIQDAGVESRLAADGALDSTLPAQNVCHATPHEEIAQSSCDGCVGHQP
jgi:CheY-like chemotaxis protein